MSVTTNAYSNNETKIYNYLRKELGLNISAACGILANVERESSFNHLAEPDSKVSFGLFQWQGSRYDNLKKYCSENKMSYKTVEGQLAFLKYELNGTEKATMNKLSQITSNSDSLAYSAAYWFCSDFERPKDTKGESEKRGDLAKNKYYPYYSNSVNNAQALAAGVARSLGKTVAEIAKLQIGKPYAPRGRGPDKFDQAGIVYYCYNQAGYQLPDMTLQSYYDRYSSESPTLSITQILPGDLLFYKPPYATEREMSSVSVAVGGGKRVTVAQSTVYEDTIGTPASIVRILEASQTSTDDSISTESSGGGSDSGGSSGGSSISISPSTYSAIVNNDPYSSDVLKNIERVKLAGFDTGYLIAISDDESDRREFKFYVPEFEESAGTNWESTNIIGRSVSILSYSHTNSRVINISLELYAGVGMYIGSTLEESVDKLHRDANILKSLEYPDYTNPITRPPTTVHLILGAAINMIGVVSDVTINHLKPLDSQNRSIYLKVGFKVTQIANNPPDWTDIRENQYARAANSSQLLGGVV